VAAGDGRQHKRRPMPNQMLLTRCPEELFAAEDGTDWDE
jgi:hypothetical protein